MKRPISSIMKTSVKSIPVDASLDAARDFLYKHNLECAPVIDSKGKVFGILSVMHLLQLHSQKQNLTALQAWEICTHAISNVDSSVTIKAVVRLMIEERIHHVVVIENGLLKGMVTAGDILRMHMTGKLTTSADDMIG